MSYADVVRRVAQLEAEVGRLEKALRQERQFTEQQRRRADALEESARRAWRLTFPRGQVSNSTRG